MMMPLDPKPDTQFKLRQGVGFSQIIIASGQQTPDAIIGLGVSGQEDNRNIAHFPYTAAYRHSVHARHIHIQNDGIQCGRGNDFQGIRTIVCNADMIALLFEICLVGPLNMRIIVHQQHPIHDPTPFCVWVNHTTKASF